MTDASGLSGLLAGFSRMLAEPYAAMLMDDLGTEVVKVETPGEDDIRTRVPPMRTGSSTCYLSALDLKDPDDVETVRDIARSPEVVIEKFRHGGLVKFGLDHAGIDKFAPTAVVAQLSHAGAPDSVQSAVATGLLGQHPTRPDFSLRSGRKTHRWPSSLRSSRPPSPSHLPVAVIGAAATPPELGGPRRFGPTGPTPGFDAHLFLPRDVVDRDVRERRRGPLGMQHDHTRALDHVTQPCPDISIRVGPRRSPLSNDAPLRRAFQHILIQTRPRSHAGGKTRVQHPRLARSQGRGGRL
ncbi:CoA transferase [Sphaerisporangium sp. NPDC051011]|uniref:CoA transferase n=1 Tax=Sphaerisporangium sp. NPDC051011 TaxID=3155792 RepID=UPI0033F22A42